MVYFYLVPGGLLNLFNDFDKTPDSMLFLDLLPIMFVALILFYIITAVLMLMNKSFLFDRLSGSSYASTLQNEQLTKIDTMETQAETQAKNLDDPE